MTILLSALSEISRLSYPANVSFISNCVGLCVMSVYGYTRHAYPEMYSPVLLQLWKCWSLCIFGDLRILSQNCCSVIHFCSYGQYCMCWLIFKYVISWLFFTLSHTSKTVLTLNGTSARYLSKLCGIYVREVWNVACHMVTVLPASLP